MTKRMSLVNNKKDVTLSFYALQILAQFFPETCCKQVLLFNNSYSEQAEAG